MLRTMAYGRYEQFVILVHGRAPPADEEWQMYLRDLAHWLPELSGQLIHTTGGGPTSSQRRALRDQWPRTGPIDCRTAVVSSELLVRGIVNAINLFTPTIRSFRPEALDAALTYIRGALYHDLLRAGLAEQRSRLHD